jgi:hypothetical protein
MYIRLLTIFIFSAFFFSCSNKDPKNLKNEQSENIYKGPIIDMHIHAYDDIAAKEMYGMDYINPLTGDKFVAVKNSEQLRKETLNKFEEHNIVKALVSDGELWYDYAPDKIIISGRNVSADELLNRYNNGKLHAIGEIVDFYHGASANDTTLSPYFNLAEKLDIPISYHVFPGGPPGGIYYMGMKDVRVANANPLQIEEILVKHPKIKFILAHAGWPFLDEVKGLMYAHPQLYLEVGVISWILPSAEFHHFLKSLVNSGFGDRIMFGTDQMVWPGTIDKAIERIQKAEFLTAEQKEDIFFNNAATILEISQEEILKLTKRP